jgi:hypothetical protein
MSVKTKTKKASPSGSIGGTYVYDKELGRLVKISDRVPKVASKGRSGPQAGPCGPSACGGGRCAR